MRIVVVTQLTLLDPLDSLVYLASRKQRHLLGIIDVERCPATLLEGMDKLQAPDYATTPDPVLAECLQNVVWQILGAKHHASPLAQLFRVHVQICMHGAVP